MDDFMGTESRDDLQNTISMFEQILEVMPNDHLALRTLYKAYLQLEDRDKAFDRLNRLADALMAENDLEDVSYLVEQYKLFLDYDESAAVERLETLQALAGVAPGDDSGSVGSVEASAGRDLDQEMALAWRLFQEELLTQEDYSNLLTDLTESSTRDLDVPATVLHALADRGFKHVTRVMRYISDSSGAPFMSLIGFELTPGVAGILPLDFIQRRAALPFGSLGGEVMVAMLNPFNDGLKRDVELIVGGKCHAYLVDALEYDLMLKKVRAVVQVD